MPRRKKDRPSAVTERFFFSENNEEREKGMFLVEETFDDLFRFGVLFFVFTSLNIPAPSPSPLSLHPLTYVSHTICHLIMFP